MTKLHMVFDVESVGLYGEGFAVGAVVVDEDGNLYDDLLAVCEPSDTEGLDEDRKWVKDNVPQLPVGYEFPHLMRKRFWEFWSKWREKGASLWADCVYPVETNFLADCIYDDTSRRNSGPYPLHDIATAALMCGHDPTATNDRLPSELPAHNPLHDARQSARLLLEYLKAAK